MDNKEFGKLMEVRTRKFGVEIIRYSMTLPKSPEGLVVRNQITKSGTSIGANYREANHARSSKDFHNKIDICETESNETLYWLEIINEVFESNPESHNRIFNEAKELLAIFTSIGKSKH